MPSKHQSAFRALLAVVVTAAVLFTGPAPANAEEVCESDQLTQNGWSFRVSPGADDTGAIQCALDRASELGDMPTITLDAGGYTVGFVTGNVGQNIRIKGDGDVTLTFPELQDCVSRFNERGVPEWFSFTEGRVELIDLNFVGASTSCDDAWTDLNFGPFVDGERRDLEAMVALRPEPLNACHAGSVDDERRGSMLVRRVTMSSVNADLQLGAFTPTSTRLGVAFGDTQPFGIPPECSGPVTRGNLTVTESSFTGFGTAVETERFRGALEVKRNNFDQNDGSLVALSPERGKVIFDRNTVANIDRAPELGTLGVLIAPSSGPAEGPVQVRLTNNSITIPNGGQGLIIVDDGGDNARYTTRVRDNTINLNSDSAAGVVAVGLARGSVTGNEISGPRADGIVLPETQGMTVRSNVFSGPSANADIFLTPDSSNNTVVAGDAVVVDLGTDNNIS